MLMECAWQRGELLDYVMDYNTGEVIFMPRF